MIFDNVIIQINIFRGLSRKDYKYNVTFERIVYD